MIRRPLLFVYNNDRDPLERGVINLSTAQILYNEEQLETQYVYIFLLSILISKKINSFFLNRIKTPLVFRIIIEDF